MFKKLAGSSALLEDNKHNEIVLRSSLGIIVLVSYMVKKIILLVLYYLQFYLTILRGTEYFAKLNQ